MRTRLPSVLFLILWPGPAPALGQLSPEILADSHLLRAEQAIRDGDKDRARAEIDKILLLQKEHELDLVEEFHFRLAKAAGTTDLPEQALESVTKYLTAAGRDGLHYVEALELMNQMQDAIAAGKEPPPPSQVPIGAQSGVVGTPGIQTKQRDLLNTVKTRKAPLAPECDLTVWNTAIYFKTATVKDVKACIEAGADLNARDTRKNTPLLNAAMHNENPAVVQALLAAGADPNARNAIFAPLHAATHNENPAVVQALLAAGADPNAQESYSYLHSAASSGNLAVVQALLAAGADPHARDWQKNTPLLNAARHNENPVVVQALQAAVDVAATTNVGAGASSGPCEIPGYPRPANVQNLGLSWCPVTVDFQARVFALQAAGAQCAIATGSSSTPEQIQARRQEIRAACETLAALGVSNCRCP